MILGTDRLRLRPAEPKDIDAFVAALNDWEVQQWLSHPPFPYEREDGETFLAIVRADHAGSHPTMFVVADKASDEALGTISVEIHGDGTGELGYWFARACWGRGIAREAVAALLPHARRHPALRRLVAVTDPENLRSQRVLTACGFTDRGLSDRPEPSRRGATQLRNYELAMEKR